VEVPPDPFLLLGQMTTADPGHSPPGTESAWAYTHLPRRDHWEPDEIAAHVERMESVVETYAPGFRELIVGRHVLSPADLERENPSLAGGALGGGTSAAYQQLFLRPIPGLGRAGHADRPPLSGELVGSSRRRCARRARRQRRPGRSRPRGIPHRRPLPGRRRRSSAGNLPVR
jgi:phytoene dehydrogenase-like protein